MQGESPIRCAISLSPEAQSQDPLALSMQGTQTTYCCKKCRTRFFRVSVPK